MQDSMEKYIKSLRKQLIHHNYLYYVLNTPEISDYEYDMMMNKLKKLEEQFPEFYDENSPTIKVGSDNADDYPDEIK